MDSTVPIHSEDRTGQDEYDPHEGIEGDSKRRKLRKGTRSCWECKRRKVRCSFDLLSDEICVACRRRGANCVSQEYPEEVSQPEDNRGQVRDRIVRVEALLNQLVKKVGHERTSNGSVPTVDHDENPEPGVPTPISDTSPTSLLALHEPLSGSSSPHINHPPPPVWTPESQDPPPTRTANPLAGKYEKISRALHAAYPSQHDLDILCNPHRETVMYLYYSNNESIATLEEYAIHIGSQLAERPDPDMHPVLLAKRMLIFVSFLQIYPPTEVSRLSEHPRAMMNRLLDTAASLVTTNEELLGTVESLECLMLEGCLKTNGGNLRRGWLAFRRALTMAQLMGLQRPICPPLRTVEPNRKVDHKYLWFRVVLEDRLMSLVLGLPQGTNDMSMGPAAASAHEMPIRRFERVHAVVAGQILERNERGPSIDDLTTTRDIDAQLLKAARELPPRFWLLPDFMGLGKPTIETFQETMRLICQLHHYELLNTLHLPYLLRFSDGEDHQYSKITCVNASREILTRFVAWRTFNHVTSCCRPADFFALNASMTLLLAHIDSHRHQKTDNMLAHQRHSDRAMMEQVLENMELVAKRNEDKLTAKSARLLRRLLHIEMDAFRGHNYSTQHIQSSGEQTETEGNALHLSVPYFGIIRIAPDGLQKEAPWMQPSDRANQERHHESGQGLGLAHIPNHIWSSALDPPSADASSATEDSDLRVAQLASELQSAQRNLEPPRLEPQLPSSAINHDATEEDELCPCLAADVNDWAFQGVDTAFFDSLMRGSHNLCETGDGTRHWAPSWSGDLGGS